MRKIFNVPKSKYTQDTTTTSIWKAVIELKEKHDILRNRSQYRLIVSGKKSAMSSARDFSTPKNATVGAECASIPPRQPVPSHF